MTNAGPSPEYRDLLKGKITPDQYVKKIKSDVDRRLAKKTSSSKRTATA